MRCNFILIALLLIFPAVIYGQDKESDFGIRLKGYVKSDVFYDTRQTVDAREGHFFLWPAPINEGEDGNDLNATPQFNILSVQSRLNGLISGPDALGAKTSGRIEGAFFGHTNGDINGFRLRHAYLKLNWESSELLIGQTWNPLFIAHSFPGVVSFNTGAPFQPFSRNPQIRFKKSFGGLDLIAAAVSQRDFSSGGPNGSSSEYLRNAALPDMHLQLHYNKLNDETGNGFSTGLGGAYKEIVPRLSSNMGGDSVYQVNESVKGLSGTAFLKVLTSPLMIKFQGVYGQNTADLLMVSGYGISGVADPVTGELNYTPLNTLSLWTDIATRADKWNVGLFAGFTENMGTTEEMDPETAYLYASGMDEANGNYIKQLYRVSPRVMYQTGSLRLALEGEYTTTAFGNDYNKKGIAENIEDVSNMRILFAAYYFF